MSMTPVPAAGFITQSGPDTPKVGPGSQWLEDNRNALSEVPGMSADTVLTIAGGIVAPTLGSHTIDTEGEAAADDLSNIDPTGIPDGRIIIIRCADSSHVVTVKHAQGGAGQVLLSDSADYLLNASRRFLQLKLKGNVWEELGRALAGDLGLGAKLDVGIAANNLVQLDGSAKLPAVDGSNLTGLLTGMKNRIINGGMDIAQRGTSFAGLTTGSNYGPDRFGYSCSSGAVVTLSRQADAPASGEFQNSLRVAVTTADTSIGVAENGYVYQHIEGYNVRDLVGRDVALCFWVRSSRTGTHCVCFKNNGADRSFVAEYTVNAANTWERKTITLTGGLITAGSWDFTNLKGLTVIWALASGANFQTTANAWQTGNFLSTASQVNCLDTIGNIFGLTGIQLEAASIATPFEHRQIAAEIALCERYYEKTYNQSVAPGTASTTPGIISFTAVGGSLAFNLRWAVSKRAMPTVTIYSSATGAINSVFDFTASTNAAAVTNAPGESGVGIAIATIISGHIYQAHIVADAEL